MLLTVFHNHSLLLLFPIGSFFGNLPKFYRKMALNKAFILLHSRKALGLLSAFLPFHK